MTLDALIVRANSAYPDDKILAYYRQPNGKHGDTLAKFIATELRETYDPRQSDKRQLAEAGRVLTVAVVELERVIAELER